MTFARRALLVLVILAASAGSARAEFLRYYVTGGPAKAAPKLGDATPASTPVPVAKAIWFGPSVGFDVFTLDTKTKQYQLGIVPGVGYGLKYCPAGWTLTSAVLALDLFVQASLVDDTAQVPGAKFFTIEALPILTIMDWFSVGFGADEYISVDSAPSSLHWVFSFGMKKSL